MSDHLTAHEPEWEISVWPLVISFGILGLVLAFAFNFVYHSAMNAVISLGVGIPLIVIGIAGWVKEAISDHHAQGLSPASMGWFILAEAMIFVSLFASYWYGRLTTEVWPPAGTPAEMPVVLPIVMTAILVSSSFTIHHAEALMAKGDNAGFRKWLLVTMALGLAFLGCSIYEWNHLFHLNFDFSTNFYSTAFFTITGFHGGHVVVGLGIFLAILIPALAGKVNHTFVQTGSLYWHFVDIIWFFVVSQVYFW